MHFNQEKSIEIPEVIKKAFYITESGRPGPVLVDIPKDVQQEKAEIVFPSLIKVRGYKPAFDPDLSQIERVY